MSSENNIIQWQYRSQSGDLWYTVHDTSHSPLFTECWLLTGKLGFWFVELFFFFSKQQHISIFLKLSEYLRFLFTWVLSLSQVQLFTAPWTAACQGSLSITNSQSLLNFMSIKLVMPTNHFILCHPLLLLPSILPSIRVFSDESGLGIRWLKYWTFSFSISPSNEYSGLISFRIDWLDLLAVQGTLKNLL